MADISAVDKVVGEMRALDSRWRPKLAAYLDGNGEVRPDAVAAFGELCDAAGRTFMERLGDWVTRLDAAVQGLRPDVALRREEIAVNMLVECVDPDDGRVLRGKIDSLADGKVHVWVKDTRFTTAGGYLISYTYDAIEDGAMWRRSNSRQKSSANG